MREVVSVPDRPRPATLVVFMIPALLLARLGDRLLLFGLRWFAYGISLARHAIRARFRRSSKPISI